MSDNPLEVPEAGSGDVLHVAMTAALSAVPFVGLGELFKFVVAPSLDKRREQWMKLMAEAVQELQNRKGFDLAALRDNEEFITLLISRNPVGAQDTLRFETPHDKARADKFRVNRISF